MAVVSGRELKARVRYSLARPRPKAELRETGRAGSLLSTRRDDRRRENRAPPRRLEIERNFPGPKSSDGSRSVPPISASPNSERLRAQRRDHADAGDGDAARFMWSWRLSRRAASRSRPPFRAPSESGAPASSGNVDVELAFRARNRMLIPSSESILSSSNVLSDGDGSPAECGLRLRKSRRSRGGSVRRT